MVYEEIAHGATAAIYKIGEDRIFKKFIDSKPDSSIDNEYYCSKVAEGLSLGAPKIYERVNDERGRGIIMEYIQGKTLLELLASGELELSEALRMLAQCQCRVNACPGAPFPKAKDVLPARILWSKTLSDPAKAKLVEILRALPDGDRLCHTDLHPGNIMMTSAGLRIIDWCDAMCAPVWADVARTVMLFHRDSVSDVFAADELKEACRFARENYVKYYTEYSHLVPEYLDEWKAVIAAVHIDSENESDRAAVMAVIEKVL